jgi:hypothetical protein
MAIWVLTSLRDLKSERLAGPSPIQDAPISSLVITIGYLMGITGKRGKNK